MFSGFGTGTLVADDFFASSNPIASGRDAALLFDTDDGRLFYDSNGSQSGGRTLIAVLENNAAVSAGDFNIA